jgi:hypoxanthine-DNA glycosylase
MGDEEAGLVKRGLAPIASRDARLIILGSLPGDASLAAKRYYAHPTNQFWRLLGPAIGRDLATLTYAGRLGALASARVGLWDVIESATRRGSLDQSIRTAAANPLAEWLGGFPDLRAVAFNGQAAARSARRVLEPIDGIALIDLPSSSAAHTMAFADKAAAWSRLSRFLESALARPAPAAKIGR